MRIRASKDRMMKLFGYGVRNADSASAMRLASSHTVTPDVATSQPAKSEITEPETGISGETGNRGKQMRRIGKSAKFQAILKMVGVAGFEPATPASRTQCSTGLSHTPT